MRLKMPVMAEMLVVVQRFMDGVRRTQITFFISFFPGLNLRVGGFSWLFFLGYDPLPFSG